MGDKPSELARCVQKSVSISPPGAARAAGAMAARGGAACPLAIARAPAPGGGALARELRHELRDAHFPDEAPHADAIQGLRRGCRRPGDRVHGHLGRQMQRAVPGLRPGDSGRGARGGATP